MHYTSILYLCLLGLFFEPSNGGTLRKPIDVPFHRNYVPSWAAEHIKYLNGGNEAQLYLDKNSGKVHIHIFFALYKYTFSMHVCITYVPTSIFLFIHRYWVSVEGVVPFRALQHANEVGSGWLCWHGHCILCIYIFMSTWLQHIYKF